MLSRLKNFRKRIATALPFVPLHLQVVDYLQNRVRLKISLADYYRHRFYEKRHMSWEEKSRYLVRGNSVYWPFAKNRIQYASTLTNKRIQKTLVLGFGLPCARLLAIAGKPGNLSDRESVEHFLTGLDEDFVLKPIQGAQGSRILALTKTETGYRSGNEEITLDALWHHLQEDFDRGYLLEERLVNHDDIRVLSPDCLNTYRVVTIKTNDGVWHTAGLTLKVGREGAVVDNAKAGNLLINFADDGSVYCAYDAGADRFIDAHPDTGVSLSTHPAVGADEVRELAIRASEAFDFLGTIGWDIAYTPDGAKIVEGNFVYGTDSVQFGRPGLITDELAQGLTRYSWFTRWDRNYVYPGYGKGA